MSHEMTNPLNAILQMHDVVEPLLESNEDGKRNLSISRSSCLVLLMKIHDMIDYFKIKG